MHRAKTSIGRWPPPACASPAGASPFRPIHGRCGSSWRSNGAAGRLACIRRPPSPNSAGAQGSLPSLGASGTPNHEWREPRPWPLVNTATTFRWSSAMAQELSGRRIAVLATDGFEQAELEEPVKALREAGAEVEIIAPKGGEITGKQHRKEGKSVKVDPTLLA